MPDIYMCGKTAYRGVESESMNRANNEARGKNVVDPLNAALVILKKEGHRFLRGQSDAHKHKVSRFSNCLLTPKGSEEFFGLPRSDYQIVHGKEVSAWKPPSRQTKSKEMKGALKFFRMQLMPKNHWGNPMSDEEE